MPDSFLILHMSLSKMGLIIRTLAIFVKNMDSLRPHHRLESELDSSGEGPEDP